MVRLAFAGGTLELRDLPPALAEPLRCRFDPRSRCYRALACAYAEIVRGLEAAGVAFLDEALRDEPLASGLAVHREPRPYQQAALDAWLAAGGRGVVVLPTGAGKSQLALMALDRLRRSTLIVAPTLDLVQQWSDLLRHGFDGPVGIVGGGEHRVEPLTVTTYDSAYLHMEHLGARFGLVVFDECHHLPTEAYALAARSALAPHRLGLTATPDERPDREALLRELVGPIAFRLDVKDLSGTYLAPYRTERLLIEQSPEERAAYTAARERYLAFLRSHHLRMDRRDSFRFFLRLASRSDEGRLALEAYREQRRLAFAAPSKLACLDKLLFEHRNDRTLVFTDDNATAYAIGRRALLPVITHQTPVGERSEILEGLASGRYTACVTSRVLNEGIDLPIASVAVVVSGTGSVREHVQRLGRILRPKPDGGQAVLYELVAAGTAETGTSARRRDHVAYR